MVPNKYLCIGYYNYSPVEQSLLERDVSISQSAQAETVWWLVKNALEQNPAFCVSFQKILKPLITLTVQWLYDSVSLKDEYLLINRKIPELVRISISKKITTNLNHTYSHHVLFWLLFLMPSFRAPYDWTKENTYLCAVRTLRSHIALWKPYQL